MKATRMTKLLVLVLATSFTASMATAEPMTAAKGLDRIKSNLENAKANQKEYDRNLDIVNKNIGEISKAKSNIQKQKDAVSAEIVQNNESLKKVILQEKEIAGLLAKEKEKLAQETKQLEQLEKVVEQIKQNQAQRQSNIAEYENQLHVNGDEKKAWKDREGELRAQESKTIQSIRGLANEESTWTNKKKGYEGEAKRWSSEVEKQQRIQDTYQGMADQK